ncbi:uncharacterized protein A1O9_00213 [Exophiala aquamarina CBS 119918]|uniref:Protein artemis n=1 Tax=Exophiala aquamarina CBS 119918 TaxID=1182545 RepID=A0A072PQV6_9EURO|nr:uncharacterized protein A1O9_00213 [Exophiala aquamarina CBS 119918]KEF62241.1 hypothetical protein A1O9_00213 [Exophiala aquamarina CBS 119918]
MSTFDGIVKEFPTIRIDYFRYHPGQPKPAALFLSHVHSDHLLGLESVKMPFVYCSVTTRQLLLQMEKYPHRINYAKGILEARKQTYRHLKSILRPLPLQAPIDIELGPKSRMRVTLFDANHCPGAVMFLLEADHKAVVYTGDIRAEPWWVNSIVQNPVLLPYTCGIKTLDCLYLDTTFATHDEPYNVFPTKADGLMELIRKVRQCPADTLFYFRSWTLGYEKVWIALSDVLKSRVHVEEYQIKLLGSGESSDKTGFIEGPALTGFTLGNAYHAGCLTKTNDSAIKIHSCEPGTPCHSKIKNQENLVWISPIISRLKDGTEVRELGAGGGWGDLYQTLGFTFDDLAALQQFGAFCQGALKDKISTEAIQKMIEPSRKVRGYNLTFDGFEDVLAADGEKNISLQELKEALAKASQWMESLSQGPAPTNTERPGKDNPTRTIHFPYSRHSSYAELRHLVSKFRPKDICPCTVDTEGWTEDMSMESLFGDLCSEKRFFYDGNVRLQVEKIAELQGPAGGKRKRKQGDSQETASQESDVERESYRSAKANANDTKFKHSEHQPERRQPDVNAYDSNTEWEITRASSKEIDRVEDLIVIESDSEEDSIGQSVFDGIHGSEAMPDPEQKSQKMVEEQQSTEENAGRRRTRIEAYIAAKRCLDESDATEWNWYPLRSVGRKGHDEEEEEL